MTQHIHIHSLGAHNIITPSSLLLAPRPLPPPLLPPLLLLPPRLGLVALQRSLHVCTHSALLPIIIAAAASESSVPSQPDFMHKQCGPEDSLGSGAWRMEYFILVVLAPLTIVCLCCVIMFYYRRSSRLPSHSSSLPTSNYSITSDSPQVNQSPLISSHRFSAQHQQERLRKQREMVCPRSESTEKFPTSVCLLDEDEPPHMRENIRIHREVMSENGIRAPPNRTVYDSERQDFMIQCRSKTENLQRHSVRRSGSSASASAKRGGVGSLNSRGGGGGLKQGATMVDVIDSETRSPLNLVDSDSEGPPPYESSVQTNNSVINVCDDSTSSSSHGLLQTPHRQPSSPPPLSQPNSNGRYHSSPRGANRGSGVRLKPAGGDCV